MSDWTPAGRHGARAGAVRASVVSGLCLLRGLPLLVSAAPRTPLRALGIIALDTLHVLRHSQLLPRQRIRELALFLDLEGCANATWDHKAFCAAQYRALRQQLESAGLGACLDEYLARLQDLETRRPPIGADADVVRGYREAVARLSIGTAAAIALNGRDRAHDVAAPRGDGDVETLFRILMQCQIIDDVMDYAEDRSAGLPSFLTAATSLPEAIAATAEASRSYGAGGTPRDGAAVFPLRLALLIISVLARLVVWAATPRHRHAQQFAQ